MKYIKTFESFSPVNEEEGSFTKLMRGGTTVKLTPENFAALKAKYCNIVTDGKEISKATKTPLFTIETTAGVEKIKGVKAGTELYTSLMNTFKMDSHQALASAMGIYDWNGFTSVDPKESKFDADKKEFSAVKAESTRGTGFNN